MAKHRAKRRESKHKQRSAHGIRPFWSGTISFGLVSVPVQLFPGSRPAGVKFRMLDDDGVPLARRYHCPKQNRDVHREHLLRGFEVEEGEYVIMRDEELEAAEPEKTREIDLRWFVDLAEVSPLIFERSYFLTPTGDSNKAYRLLAEVIEESGRVGIATFVMRDREYLIAILAEDGILRAETLRFADEIRSPEDVGLPEKERVSRADVSRWEQLIKKHTDDALNEKLLVDDYAEAVRELAEKKRRGHKDVVRVAAAEKEDELDDEEESTPDLLETIRRSLKQRGSSSRNGHQRSEGAADSNGDADERSKEELYEEAKKLEIPNRSKLSKRQLARAIDRIHSQT
jgi:DNA end-binding protein Ku